MPAEIADRTQSRTAFAGRLLCVPLRIHEQIEGWLPPGLTPVDDGVVYLDCYRVKRRVVTADGQVLQYGPVQLSQYEEVCLTTLVRRGDLGVRKYNLAMWEDLDVMLLIDRGFGFTTRPAEIRQTVLVPSEHDWDYPGTDHLYDVNAWRRGTMFLQVSARLDKPAEPIDASNIASYYSVFEDLRGARIYSVDYLDPWNRALASGDAEVTVSLGAVLEELDPHERSMLSALAAAIPLGATLLDVAWSRRGGDVRLEHVLPPSPA